MEFTTRIKNRLFDRKPEEAQSLSNVGSGISRPIDPNASYYSPYYYPRIRKQIFYGEKTPGELGAALDYVLDYTRLRIYSWQSFLESEITQTVLNKYNLWIIGAGLKLQSEPNKYVLKQEGITVPEDFSLNADERFKVWAKSKASDYSKMLSFNQLSPEVHKCAMIGGDVLVVLRVVKGRLTQQVIDGEHVMTPYLNSESMKAAQSKGNKINYGVEKSKTGEHVAYHVLGSDGKFYRVPRVGARSGRIMAYLVYGSRYRIEEDRGMPLISAVLETLTKLDRYKEATVGSAEERQKIAYAIEHGKNSTGENVLLEKVVQSRELGMEEAPETKSELEYEEAATKVATSTGKQAFNMPIDAQLKLLESKNELYFKEFYDTNFDAVCSSRMIPPEVARSMYNSNYSASRAAIKDWEHTVKTARIIFSEQYNQPYFNLWLDLEVLSGKIAAPGMLQAMKDKNIMAIESYRNARWIGANVPHIDPLKEVMAERKKLADDTTALITYEQATENLGAGDWKQNNAKVIEEKKLIPKEPEPEEKPPIKKEEK